MTEKKKGRRLLLPVIVVVIAVIALLSVFSPYPASFLMRALFNKPNITPPAHEEAVEGLVYVHNDITYPSLYSKNTVDIYLPEQTDGNSPVILWAHGGAYVGGDKTDVKYYAAALAFQGYAVISMNYDLAPEGKYPGPLHQIADVCKWLESVQEEYSIDTSRLFLAGDSAGAHMMVQFALIQTSQEYADLCGLTATIETEKIKGMLLYCGPYDAARLGETKGILGFMMKRAAWAYYGSPNWLEKYGDEISVVDHITKDFPPAFITDANTMSFPDHGEKLADTLRQKQVPVETYFMPAEEEKTIHEYQFIMNTPAGQECYKRTLEFLDGRVGDAR